MVTATVENKQDAVDYLTWTLYYRRLTQNPNYYSLQGSSNALLSDHLSELVETCISDLEESKCITVENDMDVSALNLGMIASYYYISHATVDVFAASVTAKTRIKGALEILCAASEFSNLPSRQGESDMLERMARHLPQALPARSSYDDPALKTLVLLQTHFSRGTMATDFTTDLKFVLKGLFEASSGPSGRYLVPWVAQTRISLHGTQSNGGAGIMGQRLTHASDPTLHFRDGPKTG